MVCSDEQQRRINKGKAQFVDLFDMTQDGRVSICKQELDYILPDKTPHKCMVEASFIRSVRWLISELKRLQVEQGDRWTMPMVPIVGVKVPEVNALNAMECERIGRDSELRSGRV